MNRRAMRPSAYAAHRGFVAPALGTPGLRPVILGFIIVESLYELAQRAFGAALERLAPGFAQTVFDGTTPAGMLTSLASFLLLAVILQVVLRIVHGRALPSLVGPPARAFSQFRATLLPLVLLLFVVEIAPPWWSTDALAHIRPPLAWLVMLAPALAALLIQTGAEELFYRGYLQQQVAAWDARPWVWLTLPNLAFAFAHWNAHAPLGINAQYVVWAFAFGLAASDLTARAGSLGPALALHLANNAYAFLLYGELHGRDSGLALFLFDADGARSFQPASLVAELALVGLMWLAARVALRR
ncbi:CPBP family intramembrane glutamic endopeptidase [Aquicoccus sp.]|uniref:CPBP family intramembrane glutamic endopeptidase n=1 Tax=Aquicoccus sp. TaxID=2055851 RepID=UPI003567A45F